MIKRYSLLPLTVFLVLTVTLPRPAQSQGPESDVAGWLNTHVIPLETTEPGHGYADLLPLKDAIGDARIVALGEATHGTHEFFTMKHRMVEFLVQEMGFTIFAMEANWPETERINHYVHTGEGDPAELLDGLYFWTWNTQEVLDLIEWLRQYNETATPEARVSFVGFDAQAMDLALENVLAYLREVDLAAGEHAVTNYACLETYNLLHYGSPDHDPLAYGELPLEEKQQCGDSVRAVYDRLVQYAHQFTAQSSEDAYNAALRNALTLVQAEEAMARRYTSGPNPRDRYMAENVNWLLEQGGPDAKIILWAHNGHVMERGQSVMGARLARQYEDDYVSFGFAFDRGSFNARDLSFANDEVQIGKLTMHVANAAPNETIESFLREAESPAYILDVRNIDYGEPGAKWLRNQHLTRTIGSAYNATLADQFFGLTTLPITYDFIIFIEETTASELLPAAFE